MGRNVYDAVDELPLWQLVFVLILVPVLCGFAFKVVLPDLYAIYSGDSIVSYSLGRVYALSAPILLIPLELLLVWKFVLKKTTNCRGYKFVEKFMLYAGIVILICAPLSNFAMKYYMKEKGYIYCQEQSDAIWYQVYVLDDQLCVKNK